MVPDAQHALPLADTFSRTISYLRLSLTDRCNLRCLYCTPQAQECVRLAQDQLLSYEELLRVVRVAVRLGIRKVRLTGGEPLVRRGVVDFVERLAAIEGLHDIRLTTNGVLLAEHAEALYRAGIRKVNISLDSLRPERFAAITGADFFQQVWQGIETVRRLGFAPVKLNMVVLRGVNDDELEDFARLAEGENLQVRFIEYMPIGAQTAWSRERYMATAEIMERIGALGALTPLHAGPADGPARTVRLEPTGGVLGFISPISHHFCDRCNRLRLTSEGRLRSCLLHDEETDLRAVLRSGGADEDIAAALVAAVRNKPKGHRLEERLEAGGADCHGRMSRIGG
ncbi:MAG: cyclic pyranopterin phosphate synthase MoaA [Desulfobulbaceae bacterium A2]|nr:MAG: cyclic pyranopterin phosphate synthase MoaA [Desulfobulbaceae bacterium A2]